MSRCSHRTSRSTGRAGTATTSRPSSIRGISGGGGTTSERGVALYIDGIYVPRTNGSVFKVFDIERIGGGFWDAGGGAGVAAPPRSALGAVRGQPRELGITVRHNFH